MRILADITWCGRVIWWRLHSDSWRRARRSTRCVYCDTSNPRRRRTGIGLQNICGWTGVRTGAACIWMRPRFPFFSSIACVGAVRRLRVDSSVGGSWFVARLDSWCAMVRSHSRIDGKKTRIYSRRSLWRWRSRDCWPQQMLPTQLEKRQSPSTCGRRPTIGTTTSNVGPMPPIPTSRGKSGWKAITFESRRRIRIARRLRLMDSFP